MNECCSTDRGRLAIAEERRRPLVADVGGGRSARGRVARPAVVSLAALIGALLLLLFGAGCRFRPAGAAPAPGAGPTAGDATPAAATPAAPETAYLEEALAQMPADAARFAFTDWRRVRGYHGFEGDSERSGRDERVAYMLEVMKMSQAAAQMDSAYFLFQAQNWGWDSTDLVWEAHADWMWLTESVFILRFRDDFEFARLRALLQERGFIATRHRGQTIHNVPLGRDPDWHFRSHLAHHTMAILPEEKLLLMAPTPEPIHRVLAVRAGAGDSLLGRPAVAGVVDPLSDQAAVEMQLGADVCRRYGREQAAGTELSPYTLLAAGYLYEGELQSDLLLFHYEDEGEAAADLEERRAALEGGASTRRGVLYGREFTVEEAAVRGSVMRFRLAPTAALRRSTGWPQTLMGWVQDGDAHFAACAAR